MGLADEVFSLPQKGHTESAGRDAGQLMGIKGGFESVTEVVGFASNSGGEEGSSCAAREGVVSCSRLCVSTTRARYLRT